MYKWLPADKSNLFITRPVEVIVDLEKYIEILKSNGYIVNNDDIPKELKDNK